MIQRNFKLALTAGRTIPLVIPASQYDSGEQWIFTLIDETGAKYTPATGAIIGLKSDKTAILNAGTVDAAGRVVINETEQMTAAIGKNVYEILIDDQTHGSANFIVMVEPRPGDQADFSDSDLSLLEQAIQGTSETAIKAGVSEWMTENMTGTSPAVDSSLSITGAAADAKKTGDEISSLKSAINNSAKSDALDAVTANLVYVGSDNKWNPSDETVGAINASGTTYEYTNYCYLSEPIPVEEGDVVRSYEIMSGGNFAQAGMRWLCAYNSNKNVVAESGSDSNITSYTVPSGIAYVQPTLSNTSQKRMITINKEVSAFAEYVTPNYVAGDNFIQSLDIAKTDFDSVYLDYSMVNRLNPDECQIGKFINGTTGAVTDHSSYFLTNYMEIHEGETLYFNQIDKQATMSARSIAAYDKDKKFLSELGTNTATSQFTQSGDAAFIRCAFAYLSTDVIRTPYGVGVMSVSDPAYITRYGGSPVVKSRHIRQVINVYASDSEQTVIGKFVQAFDYGDCDVVFERATYQFGTALATVKSDYHLLMNEIPIGNGCRYFFNGARLVAVLPLASLPDETGGDEFYCNFFGCQSRPSSYEMYDGVLEATDTRYVVHDESHGYDGTFKHLYQNMEMHYHTSVRTEDIRKCIGGGTGVDGVVEIVGCKFTTDAQDACVSYHGNNTDVSGATFDLNVRDSYFSNGIRGGVLASSQTARLFYVGNYSQTSPLTYDRWTVTSFNNVTAN